MNLTHIDFDIKEAGEYLNREGLVKHQEIYSHPNSSSGSTLALVGFRNRILKSRRRSLSLKHFPRVNRHRIYLRIK